MRAGSNLGPVDVRQYISYRLAAGVSPSTRQPRSHKPSGRRLQMKASVMISIFSLLIVAMAEAQSASVASACGQPNTKFDVKVSPYVAPGAETERAIMFIIERDLTARTLVTPSTRLGMDGEWLGATKGNSYSFFVVTPGIHHLCANTRFGGVGGVGDAFLHFDAKPGATYFFEVRNTRVEELHDVSLVQVDEDEGKHLLSTSAFVSSRQRD